MTSSLNFIHPYLDGKLTIIIYIQFEHFLLEKDTYYNIHWACKFNCSFHDYIQLLRLNVTSGETWIVDYCAEQNLRLKRLLKHCHGHLFLKNGYWRRRYELCKRILKCISLYWVYQCLQLGGRSLTNGGAWSGAVDDYCRLAWFFTKCS